MDKNLTIAKLRCLVVDDEETAHYALIQLIKNFRWLSFEGSCYSAIEAIDVIAQVSYDIIFLDIQMPGLSGLDLLKLLRHPRPQIIITTAFREYAYDGFLHEVCHFLLKPIAPLLFTEAVLKARKLVEGTTPAPIIYELPQQNDLHLPDSTDHKKIIWIKSSSRQHPIKYKNILYIQGDGNYVKIFHTEGMIQAHYNVKGILAELPEHLFVRINRSVIVNKYAVEKIDGNMILLKKGIKFQVPAYKSRDMIMKQLTS